MDDWDTEQQRKRTQTETDNQTNVGHAQTGRNINNYNGNNINTVTKSSTLKFWWVFFCTWILFAGTCAICLHQSHLIVFISESGVRCDSSGTLAHQHAEIVREDMQQLMDKAIAAEASDGARDALIKVTLINSHLSSHFRKPLIYNI